MMRENNSMLVQFQKLCKTLNWNSLIFFVLTTRWRVTWFRWTFESWSKDQPEKILLPWIWKYGCAVFNVLFCLVTLIFQHRQNYSPSGFVYRTDTLDRRPAPISLRCASLRSRFAGTRQGEPPQCFRRSDPLIRGYLGQSWPFPRVRVRAEIALPRGPKWPILNLGLLSCWRGAATSVDILESTGSLRARFRVYEWKLRVSYDAWETWSAPWRLKKRILS